MFEITLQSSSGCICDFFSVIFFFKLFFWRISQSKLNNNISDSNVQTCRTKHETGFFRVNFYALLWSNALKTWPYALISAKPSKCLLLIVSIMLKNLEIRLLFLNCAKIESVNYQLKLIRLMNRSRKDTWYLLLEITACDFICVCVK